VSMHLAKRTVKFLDEAEIIGTICESQCCRDIWDALLMFAEQRAFDRKSVNHQTDMATSASICIVSSHECLSCGS
jgi:hypothetical protein